MNRPRTREAACLAAAMQPLPPPADREAAEERMAEIVGACPALDAAAPDGSPAASVLAGAFGASSHLTALVRRDPEGTAEDLDADPNSRLTRLLENATEAVAAAEDEAEAKAALRRAKAHAARVIALADLGRVWDTDEVVARLSDVADALIGAAVRWCLAEAARTGDLAPADPDRPDVGSGYVVLGLGKLGGRELNYSSDVDLVVLFEGESAPVEADEPAKLFVRLTKKLVKLLQERTADGYAFRTDLRLRPDPGATNVAISVSAAAQYYESMGQNWERAAMIKARPVAGDLEAGEAFLAELSPFIWRRYLDYAAIADIHSIKRQIQAHRGHGKVRVPGHNIKVGRGGIREIEFFAQTQQLIAGGRQPDLRGRGTLETLDRLVEHDWILPEVRDDLAAAYRFLRHIENRLQMVADEQTHVLPKTDAELESFAPLVGLASADELGDALIGHMRAVEKHYSALFETAPSLGDVAGNLVFTGSDDDPGTLETLAGMGFSEPPLISATVRGWHYGRYGATRSATARERLTELVPALLRAFADSEHPDQAIIGFDRFLAGLPAGAQLFAMLHANPHLLRLMADVMGNAPRLARVLAERPRTLEAMIDHGFDDPVSEAAAFGELAQEALSGAVDLEDALDRARAFGQEQMFRIGVRVLSGASAADDTGAAYSALAEALIEALLNAAGAELARQHGVVPGGAAAVIGMGKLGGREMTATSDLDLILIYDAPEGVEASDGQRPLPVGRYYTRLTQRLISALSVPTAEGRLFEVDMRLRPSGRAGPVATRLSAFRDYHAESAWTWEKMALTRARVVAGDTELAKRVEEVIGADLTRSRDAAATAADIVSMRERIAAEKGTDDIWNLKQVRGGLIDLEFIAQFLQLVSAHDQPEVLDTHTGAALRKLARAGRLDAGAAEELAGAFGLYHELTQLLRVCLGDPADPRAASEGLKRRLAAAAGVPDFAVLEADLAETEGKVRGYFQALVGAAAGGTETERRNAVREP